MEKDLIKIENLSIGFKKGRKQILLFEDIQLTAQKSELIAVIGANGVGKSTLLRTIANLQPILKGNIWLNSNDGRKKISKMSANQIATNISFTSTEPITASHLKVYDLIALGRYPYSGWFGTLDKHDVEAIELSIDETGIRHLICKFVSELSDGERQKVMIAKALSQDTEIILLDEPTAFLDLPNKYELINLLHHLSQNQGKTIIFSTHDLSLALKYADKLWVFVEKTIYEGAPEDLIISGDLQKVFENSNLVFDHQKGDFQIKKTAKAFVNLSSETVIGEITSKALERIGIHINQNIRFPKIEITKNEKKWIFNDGILQTQFISIYELVRFLKSTF